jgi:hypothetical protein
MILRLKVILWALAILSLVAAVNLSSLYPILLLLGVLGIVTAVLSIGAPRERLTFSESVVTGFLTEIRDQLRSLRPQEPDRKPQEDGRAAPMDPGTPA